MVQSLQNRLTAPLQGPPSPGPQPGPDQKVDPGLAKAARQFEAVFLNQLMRAMRSTVPENKLFNSGGPTRFYQQMQDAEIAKSLAADHGGMGIADLIVRQLSPASPVTENPEETGDVASPRKPAQVQPALDAYRRQSVLHEGISGRPEMAMPFAGLESDARATWDRFAPQFRTASRDSGLPPSLLLAVVMEESGGDPQARSSAGARGLMQLMPPTAAEMGVDNPDHPGQNLTGGARYLAQLLTRYDGNLDLALAAYNAGPGNVDRAGGKVPDFSETRNYVRKVTDRLQRMGVGTDLASMSHEMP